MIETNSLETNSLEKNNFDDIHNELKKSKLSPYIEFLYDVSKASKRRSFATFFFNILFRLEGGHYRSATVRKLLARDYQCYVGVHSYGALFILGAFSPRVEIGKYTSVGPNVSVYTQNHPVNTLSTHPYFYEKQFNLVEKDTLAPATTKIGHDVWIGQNAVILPGCKHVGTGSIIGAGAIVTKDVPAYAIVAGNPAKVIKYRFDKKQCDRLLSRMWWDKPFDQLNDENSDFNKDNQY